MPHRAKKEPRPKPRTISQALPSAGRPSRPGDSGCVMRSWRYPSVSSNLRSPYYMSTAHARGPKARPFDKLFTSGRRNGEHRHAKGHNSSVSAGRRHPALSHGCKLWNTWSVADGDLTQGRDLAISGAADRTSLPKRLMPHPQAPLPAPRTGGALATYGSAGCYEGSFLDQNITLAARISRIFPDGWSNSTIKKLLVVGCAIGT